MMNSDGNLTLAKSTAPAPMRLPERLLMEMAEESARLSRAMAERVQSMESRRGEMRRILGGRIERPGKSELPLRMGAVDGANVEVSNVLGSVFAACAVRLNEDYAQEDFRYALQYLPNSGMPSAVIAGGAMTMMEIMAAVSGVERDSESFVLVDGSRMSAMIQANQFYAAASATPADREWLIRVRAGEEKGNLPDLIRAFESRDWTTPYLTHPRILASAKMVRTDSLPSCLGVEPLDVDDKAFATCLLDEGEALPPVFLSDIKAFSRIEVPFHVSEQFPGRAELKALSEGLVRREAPEELAYLYFKVTASHGVTKVEVNRNFLSYPDSRDRLFGWWKEQTRTVDIMEPLPIHLADRMVKSAVSSSVSLLEGMLRHEMRNVGQPEFFGPRRTPGTSHPGR
jgi:hypothetical protein